MRASLFRSRRLRGALPSAPAPATSAAASCVRIERRKLRGQFVANHPEHRDGFEAVLRGSVGADGEFVDGIEIQRAFDATRATATTTATAPAALLERLALMDKRTALPGTLSRGMRQKLALGCAFIHDPSVLLLDEPLTGLDPHAIRSMKDMIVAHAERGAAVLLSSHQLSLVSELCHEVVVLRAGQAVARATPAELAGSRQAGGRGLEDAVLELLS